VYLHGLGGDGSDVTSINTPLASQARICTYDRVNVGRSDRVTGHHTGADSVRDLHALLDAAGVPGPYLLVGFSFGGLLAIMYAGTYPDQVTGMVSLDGSLPTDDEVDQLIPEDERARVMAEQDANQESVDFYRTKAVPAAGWSRCSPPTTSTWTRRSSSSRRSTGSSIRRSAPPPCGDRALARGASVPQAADTGSSVKASQPRQSVCSGSDGRLSHGAHGALAGCAASPGRRHRWSRRTPR
jgi:pimeloyl-ACP methyl ester carboxylesterase